MLELWLAGLIGAGVGVAVGIVGMEIARWRCEAGFDA